MYLCMSGLCLEIAVFFRRTTISTGLESEMFIFCHIQILLSRNSIRELSLSHSISLFLSPSLSLMIHSWETGLLKCVKLLTKSRLSVWDRWRGHWATWNLNSWGTGKIFTNEYKNYITIFMALRTLTNSEQLFNFLASYNMFYEFSLFCCAVYFRPLMMSSFNITTIRYTKKCLSSIHIQPYKCGI